MTAVDLPAIRAQYEDAPRLLVSEATPLYPASVYEEADGLDTVCVIPGYYSPEAQNALAHRIAAAPSIVAQLLAVVDRMEGLAAEWEGMAKGSTQYDYALRACAYKVRAAIKEGL